MGKKGRKDGDGPSAGGTQHKSVPDRAPSAEQAALFTKEHAKLVHKLRPSVEGLEAVDLAPERPELLVAVPGFLSVEECEAIIGVIERVQLNKASAKDRNPRKGEAYLDRENASFEDRALSDLLWRRLQPHVPAVDGRAAVGFFAKLRYYKYLRGQRFGQHVDTFVADAEGRKSEYTLLIYLNGREAELPRLEGGETVFYATKKKVLHSASPVAGTALMHAHGPRCLMHEGAEVTKGQKFVLRTDIVFESGPK